MIKVITNESKLVHVGKIFPTCTNKNSYVYRKNEARRHVPASMPSRSIRTSKPSTSSDPQESTIMHWLEVNNKKEHPNFGCFFYVSMKILYLVVDEEDRGFSSLKSLDKGPQTKDT